MIKQFINIPLAVNLSSSFPGLDFFPLSGRKIADRAQKLPITYNHNLSPFLEVDFVARRFLDWTPSSGVIISSDCWHGFLYGALRGEFITNFPAATSRISESVLGERNAQHEKKTPAEGKTGVENLNLMFKLQFLIWGRAGKGNW